MAGLPDEPTTLASSSSHCGGSKADELGKDRTGALLSKVWDLSANTEQQDSCCKLAYWDCGTACSRQPLLRCTQEVPAHDRGFMCRPSAL
jgi:hypothetical protein